MVAFPWGSKSTSSTRFPACESAAARFTLVVVLPTPPFWFTTASTRAMSTLCPAKDEVTLRLHERNFEPDHAAAVPMRWHGLELRLGEYPFHGGEPATDGHQMAARVDELRKLCKCSRDDQH